MKQIFVLLIGVLYYLPAKLAAQPVEVFTQLETGVSIGNWVYHRVTDSEGSPDFGYDRTDSGPFYCMMVSGGVQVNKFEIGISGKMLWYDETYLELYEDTRVSRKRIQVSDGLIKFYQLSLTLGYRVVSQENYYLMPKISYGPFRMKTKHPDYDFFKHKEGIGCMVENGWKLKHGLYVTASANFQYLSMETDTDSGKHGNHEIMNVGGLVGIKYYW